MGICIKGAVGNNADNVNGHYGLVPNKPHNLRPQYQKVGDPDTWLVMMPNGCWYVTDTESKDSNDSSGWCTSVDHHTLTPDLASGWEVTVNGTFTKQSSVFVVGFSPAAWAVEQVSLASDTYGQMNRGVCVCVCVCG